jgi:hypothetical protein
LIPFGELAVAGHRAMVRPVGTHQVGEHPGVTRIGFGSRGPVPVPIAVHRHRVDREDLVAGGHERTDEQPAIGLDRDHHLLGHISVRREHPVQPRRALDAFGHPGRLEHITTLVEDAHVVVTLRPVDPDKDHVVPPSSTVNVSLEELSAV